MNTVRNDVGMPPCACITIHYILFSMHPWIFLYYSKMYFKPRSEQTTIRLSMFNLLHWRASQQMNYAAYTSLIDLDHLGTVVENVRILLRFQGTISSRQDQRVASHKEPACRHIYLYIMAVLVYINQAFFIIYIIYFPQHSHVPPQSVSQLLRE